MAGKHQGGGPPGFDFGDPNMPFDFSALQNVLNDPGIKQMAEQLARDPAFAQMTQSLQSGFGQERGAAPAGSSAGMDPQNAAEAMSGMFQNPQFMQMAQELGQKIMTQDPSMHEMMTMMNQPNFQERIAGRMNDMKDDPDIAKIMKDVEQKGPAAMMDYWSNPDILEKMSKVMGDVFTPEELEAPGAAGAAGEDDEEDDTPAVHNYASNGDASALKAEIAKGADVNEEDEEGRTALQFACGFGELACAEILLEAKAAVDAVDKNKNTALHYAAGYGQTETVELLLKHGADKTMKNLDDKTPLGVAEINEKKELYDLLQ